VAALALVAAIVVLSTGGGGAGSGQPNGTGAGQSGGGSATSGAAQGAGRGVKLDPVATVKSFYRRAAADDYAGAWALAGPGFRSQLGGFSAFQAQFRSLRSIRFERLSTVSQSGDRATVAIRTTALHTDHVDRCSGTVDVVRGSRWLIDHIAVSC
jgi:hypothetical protein